MSALALSDVHVLDAAPRILDLRLGQALGFDRPRDIRKLVARNLDELESHGEVCATVAQTSPQGGRPTEEFLFNEAQALLICMFARTPKAAEVRKQVIDVFMAWRRGDLRQTDAKIPGPPAPLAFPRRMGIEEAIAYAGKQSDPDYEPWASDHLSLLYELGTHRKPKFFHDIEFLRLLTTRHRKQYLRLVLDECRALYGDARTPSKSAAHRFWMHLDQTRGPRGRN